MSEDGARQRRRAWWRRHARSVQRATSGFAGEVRDLAGRHDKPDDAFFDDLLEVMLGADCGAELSERLVAALRRRVSAEHIRDATAAVAALRAEILAVMESLDRALHIEARPSVVLIVGVNGSGKTTTLGKLAYRLRLEERTVLIAAADTYRAAGIDQVRIWANLAETDVVAHQPGADPGAVVYDAIQAAESRRIDVVLVDTAGRLQTKANLMAELAKVRRVAERLIPEAPQEVLLVLDATTGMNALSQAHAFHESMGLTGLVVTKLDGTARAGSVLAIEEQLKVPVKLVGLGEDIDDLNAFDPASYLDALFGETAEPEVTGTGA